MSTEQIVIAVTGFSTLLGTFLAALAKLREVTKELKEAKHSLRKQKILVGVVGRIPRALASWHVATDYDKALQCEANRVVVFIPYIRRGDYDRFDHISEVAGTNVKIRDPDDEEYWNAVTQEEACGLAHQI